MLPATGTATILRSGLGDELADLERSFEAERFDLGQDAVEPGLVQHAGQDGLWTPLLHARRETADSSVAPRWQLIGSRTRRMQDPCTDRQRDR